MLNGIDALYACLLSSSALIGYWAYSKFTQWSRQNVPECRRYALDMAQEPFHVVDSRYVAEHGKIIGFYNVTKPALLIADVDLTRKVLLTEFDNFRNRPHMTRKDDLAGESMLFARDEKWKELRNAMTPAFSSAKLKRMQALIEQSVHDLIESLRSVPVREFDIKRFLSGFTLDVIARCAFGIKINSAKDPYNEFVKYAQMFSNNDISFEFLMVLLLSDFAVDKMGCTILNRKPGNYFTHLMNQIVKERRLAGGEDRHDFVQLLINANLTDKQLADNGMIFFLAGFDTSAITLTNVLYQLALNPFSQDTLIRDIDEYFKSEASVSYDTLMELRYLDAVINETLRLMPTFPRTARVASKDCHLGDLFLPKDTLVLISNYAIHHDEANFEKAEQFIPERFLSNSPLRHHNHAFIPFAIGPRNCIGMRFAMFEMKLCLIHLLRNFRFEICDQTKVPLDYFIGQITMNPRDVFLKVIPRF